MNKRLSKEKCPITKHVGYHACGLNQIMSKKDYIIEQRNRKEDQQLQPIGPIKEEVRAVEYRDLQVKKGKFMDSSGRQEHPTYKRKK